MYNFFESFDFECAEGETVSPMRLLEAVFRESRGKEDWG